MHFNKGDIQSAMDKDKGPKIPKSTPAPDPKTRRQEQKLQRDALEEFREWLIRIPMPEPKDLTFEISGRPDKLQATITWQHEKRNFHAVYDAGSLSLTISIQTMIGDQPVKSQEDIDKAIKAEAKAAKSYLNVIAQWFNRMGIAPPEGADLVSFKKDSADFTWTLHGHKFTATVDKNEIHVRILNENVVKGQDPEEITIDTPEDLKKALAGPEPLAAATIAFINWLGKAPEAGFGKTSQTPETVSHKTVVNERDIWGHWDISGNSLRIEAEVPPGTPSARQYQGKFFLPVNTKEDISKLPSL